MKAAGVFVVAVALFCEFSLGLPWVINEYYILTTSTSLGQEVATEVLAIPTVTPIPTDLPRSTETITLDDGFDTDVQTVVRISLPSEAGFTSPYPYNPLIYPVRIPTNYAVMFTYQPSNTECPNAWTWTEAVIFTPPDGAVISATSTRRVRNSDEDVYSGIPWVRATMVNPTDIPTASLSAYSRSAEPNWISSCAIPRTAAAATRTTRYPTRTSSTYQSTYTRAPIPCTQPGSSTSQRAERDARCPLSYGETIAALICSMYFGILLLLGLLQSYVHFHRLCCGRAAECGLPFLWGFVFLVPFCCFRSRGFEAVADETEQRAMRKRWKRRGMVSKIGLWLIYGFKTSYPVFLDRTPPPRRRTTPEPVDPMGPRAEMREGGGGGGAGGDGRSSAGGAAPAWRQAATGSAPRRASHYPEDGDPDPPPAYVDHTASEEPDEGGPTREHLVWNPQTRQFQPWEAPGRRPSTMSVAPPRYVVDEIRPEEEPLTGGTVPK